MAADELQVLRGFIRTVKGGIDVDFITDQLDMLGVEELEDLGSFPFFFCPDRTAPTASCDCSAAPVRRGLACAHRCRRPAVRLRPDEIDGLSGLSVAGKMSLVNAIGRVDLLVWLKEWGIEALAEELDELGVEEPAHAIDLLPEEIGASPVSSSPHRPLPRADLVCGCDPRLRYSCP